MTERNRCDIWTITGACNALADLRHLDGFYTIEIGAIDAPLFIPAGASERRDVTVLDVPIVVTGGILTIRNFE